MWTRTVIIGNSGSGKSHFAKSLATIHPAPIIHLDELFWRAGGFNEKRPEAEIKNEIAKKQQEISWIVEGVFGELAEQFLPRAQLLIFLDLDWAVCRAGLLARGAESSKQSSPAKAEENFKNLRRWAEQYWTRTGSCSHVGHLQLFSNFNGSKFRFASRVEVDAFLNQFLKMRQ